MIELLLFIRSDCFLCLASHCFTAFFAMATLWQRACCCCCWVTFLLVGHGMAFAWANVVGTVQLSGEILLREKAVEKMIAWPIAMPRLCPPLSTFQTRTTFTRVAMGVFFVCLWTKVRMYLKYFHFVSGCVSLVSLYCLYWKMRGVVMCLLWSDAHHFSTTCVFCNVCSSLA